MAVEFTVDATAISDPTDPRLTLALTGTQTTGMTARGYGFDVQATGGGQSPFTVWQGRRLSKEMGEVPRWRGICCRCPDDAVVLDSPVQVVQQIVSHPDHRTSRVRWQRSRRCSGVR